MKPLSLSLVLLLHGLPLSAQEESIACVTGSEKANPAPPPPKKDDGPNLKFDMLPEIAAAAPDNAPRVLGKYAKPAKNELSVVVGSAIDKAQWLQLTPEEDVSAGRTYVAWPGCRADLQLKDVKLSLCGNLPETLPVPTVIESAVDLHVPDRLAAADLSLRTGRIVITSKAAERVIVRLRLENPKVPGGLREIVDLALLGKEAQVLIDRGGRFRPRTFFKDPGDPRRDGPDAYLGVWVMKGAALLRHNTDSYALSAPPGNARLIWSTLRGLDEPQAIKELPATISLHPPVPELTDPVQLKQRDAILKALAVLAGEPAGKPVSIRLGLASDANDAARRIVAVRCLAGLGSVRFLLDRLAEEQDKYVWLETVKSIRHYITVSRDNDYSLYGELQKRHSPGEALRIMELLDGLHNIDALVDFLDNPHVTIRQLSHLNLLEVEPAGKDIPYDARMQESQRSAAQQAWMKLLHKKTAP